MRLVILISTMFIILAYLYVGFVNYMVVISVAIFTTIIVGMNLAIGNPKEHNPDNRS